VTPVEAEAAWPNRPYAWYVVVMLMLAYSFSIVDRTGLGLLVQPIEADLHISDSQMGLLQGAAFALFYTLFGLPLGFMADRTGRRGLIAAGVAFWSAATIACGFARSFPALFLARVGVGAGEATLSPAGTSMIADYFPPQARSKAYGVYVIGTSIGSGMAFLLGGAAIALASHLRQDYPDWLGALAVWKIVFFLIGAPGLVIAAVFMATVREPGRRGLSSVGEKISLKPLFDRLSSEKLVYSSLILGAVANFTAIYAMLGWFPSLLIRTHGWSPAEVGGVLGTYGVPCGVFSCLSGGWLIGWLQKRGHKDAPLIVAIGGSIWFSIAGVCASLAPSGNLAVVCYCLLSLATNYCAVSALTGLNLITPNQLRGQVVAIFTMSTGLIALSLGPFAIGFLSDTFFPQGGGIGPSLAIVFAVTGAIGAGLLANARRPFRRVAGEVV
jgi:MFS family permease